MVFVGQFAVSLVFAELSTRYPKSGAIFHWSRRVSTGPVGLFAGWSVYDPAGAHWYLQWFATLFVLAASILGALASRRCRGRRSLH